MSRNLSVNDINFIDDFYVKNFIVNFFHSLPVENQDDFFVILTEMEKLKEINENEIENHIKDTIANAFEEGVAKGECNSEAEYEKGYDKGYDDGYDEGYDYGKEKIDK